MKFLEHFKPLQLTTTYERTFIFLLLTVFVLMFKNLNVKIKITTDKLIYHYYHYKFISFIRESYLYIDI